MASFTLTYKSQIHPYTTTCSVVQPNVLLSTGNGREDLHTAVLNVKSENILLQSDHRAKPLMLPTEPQPHAPHCSARPRESPR